jgi:Xaa-Pro aminopeptidase
VTARVLAASVTSVLRAAEHNAARLTEGESADAVAAEATAAVERAFALLGHGFGHGLGRWFRVWFRVWFGG